MRDFIKRALKKTNKMTLAQIREVLALFEEEYDILAGALPKAGNCSMAASQRAVNYRLNLL